MKYYKISENALRGLIKESKFLGALESYGVDNWEGYERAWSTEDYEVSEEDYEEYGAILETEIDDK